MLDAYRFGFNGKENDNEVDGQQDYGMRIYDKRLARFKSIDPLTKKFPMLTPYQFASNTPIMADDLDGAEARIRVIYYAHVISNGKPTLEVISNADVKREQRNSFKQNQDVWENYSNEKTFGEYGTATVFVDVDHSFKPTVVYSKTLVEHVKSFLSGHKLPQVMIFGSGSDMSGNNGTKPDYSRPIHSINLGSGTGKDLLELINLSFPEVPETPKGGFENFNELGHKLNEVADNLEEKENANYASSKMKEQTFGKQNKVYDKATRATWKDSLGFFGRADGENATDTVDTRNDDTPTSVSKISNKLNK